MEFEDQIVEDEEELAPVIAEGQGTVLQQSTRNAMQQIINHVQVNMEEVDRWVQEITKWFRAVLYFRSTVSEGVWNERTFYFRALFNLTTDRLTRLRLVHFKACGLMVKMTEVLISASELDNTNIAVMVAAIANVVYEENTKREMTQEHNAAELLTKLLKNPAPNVLTHAARGVFSLTTVFDFKKIFATQPGLLESLVACLQMEPEELITNAAGALANIAIHPESKLPIANNGSLKILVQLANTHQSESVLHQTSRCLFSLAAEKTNRPKMVQEGVLQAVTRLVGLVNVEVLANIIGCLGNLCMSEVEAQNIVNVDRLLAILHKSETVVLDRQTTRILHSFAYRKELRPKFEANFDSLINKFLSCVEENVVRDLSGMFVNIVEHNAKFRRLCCLKQAFPRCITLFKQLGGVMDTVATLSRFTYLLSEDDLAVEWARDNAESTIALFVKLTEPPSQRLVAQFSYGVLANLAKDAGLSRLLHEQDVLLKRAVATLFENDSRGKRQQVGKLLINCTNRQSLAFGDMAEYGGSNGERRRYLDELRVLFRSTFSISSNGGGHNGSLLAGGLKQVVVNGLQEGERMTVVLFAPFLQSTLPSLLDDQGLLFSSTTRATEEEWTWFFQYVSTRDWSQSGNTEVSPQVLDSVMGLAKHLELDAVVSELDKIKAAQALLLQQKKESELLYREESSFDEESNLLRGIGFSMDLTSTFGEFQSCDVVFRFSKQCSFSSSLGNELYDEMLMQWRRRGGSEEEVCLGAHRHVLVSRCAYFRALFRNQWLDSNNLVYDIGDVSLEVFLLLLRFVYFGLDSRLKDLLMQDKDLAKIVLDEANKYALPGLQYYCEWSLCKLLAGMDSFDLAQFANELVDRNAPLLKLDLTVHCLERRKELASFLRGTSTLSDLLSQVGLDSLDNEQLQAEGEEPNSDRGTTRKRARLEEEPPSMWI
ncbi:hypothetical protein BASA81_003293 [Batrachochytrium salamandrivorans]|nr:hypothetical protein BASA81_003293 [Batrachochytrium salamandrivorans]